MTFLKCACSRCCVDVHCLSKKNNKNHFFTSFLCLIAARWCYCSWTQKRLISFFKLLTVPRPTNAQVLVHIMFIFTWLCYVSMSRYRCTIAPEGKQSCNIAKNALVVHSNDAFQLFFIVSCWECLEVTRNLNDIFLEVMFSIAKQNKNCSVIAETLKLKREFIILIWNYLLPP